MTGKKFQSGTLLYSSYHISGPAPQYRMAKWDYGRLHALPLWPDFILFDYWFAPNSSYRHDNPTNCAFEIPLQGDLYLQVGDHPKQLARPGAVYLLPQGVPNILETGTSGFCKKIALGFIGVGLPALLASPIGNEYRKFPVSQLSRIETLATELFELLVRQEQESVPSICGKSLELLILLTGGGSHDHLPDFLANAVYLMSSRLAEKFKISELTQLLKCSRGKLQTGFLHYLHATPKQYLTQLRMEMAKSMLCKTVQPIKMISQKTGYPNQLAFSREFRKYVGCSPSRYRQQNKMQLMIETTKK